MKHRKRLGQFNNLPKRFVCSTSVEMFVKDAVKLLSDLLSTERELLKLKGNPLYSKGLSVIQCYPKMFISN
ncbi:hypothetical protein [Bacillus niameyensis]|uniref:hypothetical protein n=1 Tax=Bacillus niameyensis TaxID=1522308 RepID=UPI00078428C4|nr:hypothetical protein [Bacillus niameyensis]